MKSALMTPARPLGSLAIAAPFLLLAGLALGALPPVSGGALGVLVAEPVAVIDPALAETIGERQVAALLSEPLFALRGDRVEGRLVLRWEEKENGAALQVWLRPAISFHDGTRLGAEDVKESYERLLSPQLGSWSWQVLLPIEGARQFRSGEVSSLEGFEIISPVEFVLHLTEPAPGFIRRLADPATAVMPKRLAVMRTPIERPVGTGPYLLVGNSTRHAELRAFKQYHGGRAFLKRISFHFTKNAETEKADLKDGRAQASLSGRIDPPRDGRSDRGPVPCEVVIRPNPAWKADVPGKIYRMLQALVDCKTAVTLFEHRRHAPFVAKPGSEDCVSCRGFRFDPEKAGELFRSLSGGGELVLRVRGGQPEIERIAERIALAAQDGGLPLRLAVLSAAQLAAGRAGSDWHFELHQRPAPGADRPDGALVLYRLTTRVVWDPDRYSPAEFNAFAVADWASISGRQP